MSILEELSGLQPGRNSALRRMQSPAPRLSSYSEGDPNMGEFQKGLRRAGINLLATSNAAAGGLAEPFAPKFAERQFQRAENISRSQPAWLAPEVAGYKQVNDLPSAVSYASGSLGEGIGSIATVLAATLLTRGAALRATPAIRNAATLAGGSVAAFPQEAGETALTLRQNPEAMANTTAAERALLTAGRGTVSSILEAAIPTSVLAGTAGRIAAGVRPAVGNIARKTAANAAGEAGTEAAQELTGQFTENVAAPGTGYDPERVIEAAIRGGITGGALGGAGGTVQAVRSNIDAAAEQAQEAAGNVDTADILNRTVERIDNIVRNPEQAGIDLTNTTMGALAEAQARAGDIGEQVSEQAGPATARGMDAVATMRRNLDRGILRRLTPENREKYRELTQNFRLLQPTEYARLRDAMDTADATEINRAVGDVAAQLYERVPRETMVGLRNLANWGRDFGRGVTSAAREGRKAAQSYGPEDVARFREFLSQQYRQVLQTMDNTDASTELARTLMAYRDSAQLLNTELRPKDREAIAYFEQETGVSLPDLLTNARQWRNDNTTPAEAEAAFEETTGDSQIERLTNDMERFLTPKLQEQLAEAGISIGPGATDRADGSVRRDSDGELMNEEDTRRSPFNSLGQIQRLLAEDLSNGEPIRSSRRRFNPEYVLPATLRSDTLSAAQIGRLLGGKDTYRTPDGEYARRSVPVNDDTIAMRTTEDGGYRQDFNSIDIVAQAGTPQERGGSRENMEAFLPDFMGTAQDATLDVNRLLAAVASINTDGLEIPRSDIDPALLEEWGLDPDGDPIQINVEMDMGTIGAGTRVRARGQNRTIGQILASARRNNGPEESELDAEGEERQLAVLDETRPEPGAEDIPQQRLYDADFEEVRRRTPEGIETSLRQAGIDRRRDSEAFRPEDVSRETPPAQPTPTEVEGATLEDSVGAYELRDALAKIDTVVDLDEVQATLLSTLQNADLPVSVLQEADAIFAERRAELETAALTGYAKRLADGTEFLGPRKRLAQVVKGLADKYLDGAEVRVVEYDPRDPEVQEYFRAYDELPLGRAVPPGSFGPTSPAMILIKRNTSVLAGKRYGQMNTLAHEFGHIVDYIAYRNAPEEVKAAIDGAYERDIQAAVDAGNMGQALFRAGSVLRYIPQRNVQAELTNPDATLETGRNSVREGINERIGRGESVYLLSKSEYFAEQFTKYVMREPNAFAEEGSAVRAYLDKLLSKIRAFYREVIQQMSPTPPEFDSFIEWLGTPAAERPALPNFEMPQAENVSRETPAPTQDSQRREGESNADFIRRVRRERTQPQAENVSRETPPENIAVMPIEQERRLRETLMEQEAQIEAVLEDAREDGGPLGPPEPPQEPPQEPPEPPAPPPPPPDNEARERFKATVQRLLGDRVNVAFDQDLPKGVAAEYDKDFALPIADTDNVRQEIYRKRREELRALKRRRNATPEDIRDGKADPRTPEQIKAAIEELNKKEQDYITDRATRGTIRVAAGMEAQAGLAEHEALHAAFEIFFGQDNAQDRRILATAFTQGLVGRRLRNYFRDNEAVLNVIDPSRPDTFREEEAAAYGFQLFLHEPEALQLGRQVEGIFNRFIAFLQRLVGYQTYEQRARLILNDLASGRRAERGVSVLRERESMERSMLNRSQDFVRNVGSGFMHIYDTVFSSAYSRLADSGNPALAQIARLGYNETGEEGQGMIQRQRHETTRWGNRLKEALHALDADELTELNRLMILGEKATGRLKQPQERLQRLLKDAHQYQVDAGTEIGFKDNYYPLIWNPEKVIANQEGFLKMLRKYESQLAEANATPDEMLDRIMAYESRGHEFQGVFNENGEPAADSSLRRALDFIELEDRLPFMEDDLVVTMAHYLNQSVRHAEFVRAYGKEGERLQRLLSEVRGVYKGTTDDQRLAKDYIDGLMGNKEVGMSRELKDVYGAMVTYQNVRLLPLSVFSSLVDPLGIAVRTNNMAGAFDAFAYSVKNIFTDFRKEWTPDQWAQFAEDMGTIDLSGTVKSIDKIYTGVTLRGKTREINDAFFKYNLLNGWVKNNHIAATKAAQLFLRRSAEGMFGEERSADNLQEVGVRPEDIMFDENLGRIRATVPEILGIEIEQLEAFEQENPQAVAEARAQAERIQQAIHKIVRQSMIQPSSADMPNWMSNPYLAPIAHLKTFVFGFNATILQRLVHEAKRGNYSPAYYAAAYVPGMIAADFIKGLAGNGGEEPEWKKNWSLGDYVEHGVHRSGLTGTGQFLTDMGNDITRGGGGWESIAGPSVEQAQDLLAAMNAETSQPTRTWVVNALPANDLYDQWLRN
jgi:hypothetical protein